MRGLATDKVFSHPGLQRVSYYYPDNFGYGADFVIPSGIINIELSYFGAKEGIDILRSQLEAHLESENRRLESERQEWFDRYHAPFKKAGVYYASEYGFPPQPVTLPDKRKFGLGCWQVAKQITLTDIWLTEIEVEARIATRTISLGIPDMTSVAENKDWEYRDYGWYS